VTNAVSNYPGKGVLPLVNCEFVGCGDISDIAANGGTNASETDCAAACSGDPIHLCGGAERLNLYEWQGSLNTWHTPSNVGRYEVRSE